MKNYKAGLFATVVILGTFAFAFSRANADLLVSSVFNHSILRYRASTGAFVDEFVPPGSGGLSNPQGLIFGPDGHLYVSSAGTASVLRYNGTTGAFTDAFVPAFS